VGRTRTQSPSSPAPPAAVTALQPPTRLQAHRHQYRPVQYCTALEFQSSQQVQTNSTALYCLATSASVSSDLGPSPLCASAPVCRGCSVFRPGPFFSVCLCPCVSGAQCLQTWALLFCVPLPLCVGWSAVFRPGPFFSVVPLPLCVGCSLFRFGSGAKYSSMLQGVFGIAIKPLAFPKDDNTYDNLQVTGPNLSDYDCLTLWQSL